ncbi:MAG: FHA domain-containing protein [Ardenticatenaceae bacterium]|nr:FHA domain-containing protein [Ardenticatenaceae bacterium]
MADIYHLLVQRGPRIGQTFSLDASIITIGRDPMSDIALPDPEISRQHARMARDENGDYKIQDLGSTNGTFVNGQRLSGEPYTLQSGQTIILGSSVALVYEKISEDMAVGVEEETAVADEFPADTPAEPIISTPLPPTGELAPPEAEFTPADMPEQPYSPSPTLTGPIPTGQPFVPAGPSEQDKKRKRTITWVAVTIVLLLACCCAFLLSAYYWWGDPLMEMLGFY